MSADLDSLQQCDVYGPTPYAVTVLAPLGDPETRTDLERPEAAVLEVFDAMARLTRRTGRPTAEVVPVRRKEQPRPHGSRARSVEMLDATTLEDVADALADGAPRVVHAVGWEAGIVAAAVRQTNAAVDGAARPVVVLEPLGVPGEPEWSLADHAAALVVQSPSHRRSALCSGIATGLVHVVPPVAPRCPDDDPTVDGPTDGGPVLAVVGGTLAPALMDTVEWLLRGSPDLHIVFAGTAGRASRARTYVNIVRSWPDQMSARLHAAPTVTWPLLAHVDGVLEASTPQSVPRAALAAMAAGRAVLAVADSPAREVVGHGQTGICLPGTDPTRLAAAIRQVVTDAPLLRTLGRAGRSQWSREHAPDARARRLAAIYDLVAG